MKKSTIKLASRVVVEFHAGNEIDTVVDGGDVYVKLGDFTNLLGGSSTDGKSEEAEEAPAKKSTTSTKKAPAKKAAPKVEKAEEVEEEEAEDPEPKKPATRKSSAKKEEPAKKATSNEDVEEAVYGILGDLDNADLNEKKAVEAIVALGEDVDKAAVTKVIKKFQEDAELDTEEVAKELIALVNGEEAEEKAPAKKAPAKKSTTSTKKAPAKKVEEPEEEEEGSEEEQEGEEVEIKDLKEGDDVDVYFEELEDWFTGIVLKVARGKVTVEFEDGDKVVLDPKLHTSVQRFGA